MRVQFIRDHTRAGENRPRRAGELADLPDDEATVLIAEGRAKLHEHRPTETKAPSKVAEAKSSYEGYDFDDDEDGYAPV